MTLLRADHIITPFDTIIGTAGNDTLTGTDGDDSIAGGDGDDTLDGGLGNDVIVGDKGRDVLIGGLGDDTLVGAGGVDTLRGGSGNDTLLGGGDGAFADYSNSTGVNITGTYSQGASVSANGTDQLFNINGFLLGAGDDTVAYVGAITLFDLGGNNHIDASGQLHTGDGADFFNGSAGLIDAGGGNDTINGCGGVGSTILAGAGDDVISGPRTGTTIDGGDGYDVIMVVGAKLDLSHGPVSNIEAVIGNGGKNEIIAAASGGHLFGMDGKDHLIGGAGVDVMTGGAGADQFSFLASTDSPNATPDEITDLDDTDTIDLHKIDADATHFAPRDQAFHLAAAFTGHAGELVLTYDAGSNTTRIQGDTDGDGLADFTILADGDHHAFTHFVL